MTIEEKVVEILNVITYYNSNSPKFKNATKAICDLIKPMSREKLILIIQGSELATGVGPFEKWKAGIKQLADAILTEWRKE